MNTERKKQCIINKSFSSNDSCFLHREKQRIKQCIINNISLSLVKKVVVFREKQTTQTLITTLHYIQYTFLVNVSYCNQQDEDLKPRHLLFWHCCPL